jgi:hypothetical protein
MHFLLNLLRIKGLYMFRALLAHPRKALHKWYLVYCVCVMSVGCTRIEIVLTLVSLYWDTVMHGQQNITFALLVVGLTVCLCFLRLVRQVWRAELQLASSERCSACTHMSYITCCLVSPPTCTVQPGRLALLLDKRWRRLFRMCHGGILRHPTSKEVAILTLITWSASEFLIW